MTRVLLIELNEINFAFVAGYGRMGKLPNLTRLIAAHGVSETSSERRYEELEPWIQWVTAHTGQTLRQHAVFRLGDIVDRDIPQIWETLENRGLKVGAISPMNAKNRTRNAAFFIPDPWTEPRIDGSYLQKQMYGAIAQAVNDNATRKMTIKSAFWLALGAFGTAQPGNYFSYIASVLKARGRPWMRSLVLDRLLADLFIGQVKQTDPDFASLFLNAGAHIQHHYMFSSACYSGQMSNPDWYIDPSEDPLLDILELYDHIIGEIETAFPQARLMIATGLHQEPHEELTFYWRLRDHATFLRRIGAPFVRVAPRMSRDFQVVCADAAQAAQCEQILASAAAQADGEALFEIDNRGSDLFVSLVYAHDISPTMGWTAGGVSYANLKDDVAFVAVKNGVHHGIGYFVDTGAPARSRFALAQLPSLIESALLPARLATAAE